MSNRPRRYVVLTMVFHEEGNNWVGVCKNLGVSSWGDTFEEVRKALDDLVLLNLNTLEELGERERFFEEHNIVIQTGDDDDDTVPFNVHPGVFATAYRHDLSA